MGIRSSRPVVGSASRTSSSREALNSTFHAWASSSPDLVRRDRLWSSG
ncbi:hypothetical protein IMZ48_19280 [Candidatus Bathyarchaeota archaeon]|nr:hypothetical protein [Candidatus Bathyarchaeota archaeon]